jgi:hypothetical protein
VYSIVYELHRIAPNILTTVIGTVASSLVSGDVGARGQATKLLGRLFGARTSDVARRFAPCFREWLRRSYGEHIVMRMSVWEVTYSLLTSFSRFLFKLRYRPQGQRNNGEMPRQLPCQQTCRNRSL